jgi:hypothetical protein
MSLGAPFRVALVLALATGGVPGASAQDATALAVSHEPISCMVAGEHPQIEARLVPAGSVESARVLFHSALGDDFYYVEMRWQAGRFVGILPRPRLEAGPVTYYVEGLGRDYTQTQTAQTQARVVGSEGECEGKVADYVPGDVPVNVFSLTGSTAIPPGFGGVGSVAATGAAATAAAAPVATGSFITSDGGLVLIGATAVGVGLILVTRGDEDVPVSPSR